MRYEWKNIILEMTEAEYEEVREALEHWVVSHLGKETMEDKYTVSVIRGLRFTFQKEENF